MGVLMSHSNQLDQDIQQIISADSKKVHTTTVLFSIQSTLTTVFQINIILSIIMSILIPFAMTLNVQGYILFILAGLMGFILGVNFAIILIQKYILKVIQLM